MASCEHCDDAVRVGQPHAEINVEPKGALSDVLEPKTVVLCVGCIQQHQKIADVDDDELLSADEIKRLSASTLKEKAAGD